MANNIRDLVLDLIWKQLLYPVHYHRNIKQLNGTLYDLDRERTSLQHQIDKAKNNAEKIEEKVLYWLGEVDKLYGQVLKFHEEKSRAKAGCSIIPCPNPWLRYKLSKKSETIAQEAVKLYGKRYFDKVSYRVPPQSMWELTNRESNQWIESRVEIKNHIMEALRNPRFDMIGLCGLGGVGKTTIAKDIEKEEKNQKVFEKVIMATVSQEINIGQIQDQIIEKLGIKLSERTEEGKASYLYERLEKEKNVLLILDDLWQELDLHKVGIPFTNEGRKILLTSRNGTLLSKSMKCQKIITVGVLLEDEAWEFFQSIAKVESSSPDLKSIATEIVQMCGGLPLAIATAAKLLKDENIDGWRDYLARLKNPLVRSVTGIKKVDTILKLSYEPLSREHKDIFLLSAMLAHDPSIEDLLMYSVGLDILKYTQNMEDAHNAIFHIVGKLKSLNLFLDSSSSYHFTMHNAFRDFALSIAASEKLNAVIARHSRLNEWPDKTDLECCKGICLQESDICDLPEELHGPILEFFLLNSKKSDLTIPNMFFKSSEKLKVLAITNVEFSSLPSLSFLQRLKVLCLQSCLLEDIAEVKSLKNLKVLSLAYSEIQRLPIELAQLTFLQMLNLSHCSKLKVIPQKLLYSLKKLEVLHMGNSFNQWKVEASSKADENASLDELMNLPISSLEIHIPNLSMLPENFFLKMNLRRYKIFIGERWTWQSNYGASKILKLELESSIDLTARLRNLSKGVEDLRLYGSNGQENVLYDLDVSGFPCLRHLQIESNDDIKYIVLNSAHHEGAFPILESLKLKNLKALENLCEGPNDIVFRQLHTLKMKNLPALIGDFSIKDRATKNASNKIFKSLFNKVLLLKLETLELSNLNSLIPLIWDDQLLHNSFNNLKTLMVKSSGFVKLVPLHVLKSLNNLEELDVVDCDMLEIVFDFEDLNYYYKEMESSSVVVPLKMLKLRNLPKLKNVWSSHYQGNVSFPSLRRVDVYDCERLTSIFPASIAKDMLCDLEELEICQCGVDVIVTKGQVSESVAVTFRFPRLTSLVLFGLPNLRNFYPQKHTLEWPHLNQLSIQCCDELEIFDKEVSGSLEIYEEENMLDSKYPLLSHYKVIGNLERLRLQGKEVEKIGSGQILMYLFPKLRLLHLSFQKERPFPFWEWSPNLGELKLSGDFEKALGDDNVVALAARFPKLTLENISIMGSLSPSLVSSPNLIHLNVKWCYGTALMTSSIARCLVHLTHLSISNCYETKEIITKQEGEDDEDSEIYFKKLEFLELTDLPRLRRFCCHNFTFRFPLLDKLVITRCPKFKIFSPGLISTPSLKSIQLSQGLGECHEIWDTNLNKTFYHQRYVTSREVVLDKDEASMIMNDQFPADRCPQAKILRIKGFVEEWVTFPYTLLERFPQLNELHVKNSSFREIFPSHCHIVDQIPQFEKLSLANLDQLQNIFPSHAPSSTSFHNLTVLKVFQCHQLVYLVTNSTAQSLVNLETLDIYGCASLEEIIRKEPNEDVEEGITLFNGLRILKLGHLPRLKTQEDKEDFNIEDRATNTRCSNIPISLFSQNKVLLPKLEILELSDLLNNLISLIWYDQILHNSFNNLKTLILGGCDFMKMVPLRVLKYLNNLEKLEVKYCHNLKMVLGFEDLNDYHKEMESSSVFVPLSLTHLEVNRCSGLTTLMTSSAARSLVHITHFSISSCDQIEEIIMKQEGEDDKDSEIIFNQLKFLELVCLPRLKRFCGYNYTFRFPLLEHVTITGCPRLTMFCPKAIHAPRLQSVQVHTYEARKDIWMVDLNNTIQHLFSFDEVISTCRSMALNSKNITMITDVFPKVSSLYVESFTDEGVSFPYSSLERFPTLDELNVEHCSFEEIFPSQDQIIDFMGKIPPFKELYIAHMDKLKSIWKDDSQLLPTHQNLRFLEVKSCCSLVKLAPSSASFQNLRGLNVSGCHQLIHLVTTSIAKSLVSLGWLEINDCKSMVEIVMNDTNDVQVGITFNKLYGIKVTDMPSLKMFSPQSHTFEFPKLEEIEISGCPEMKMFCPGLLKTPKLSKVKIEEHGMEWKDREDLNKTMEGLSSAKQYVTSREVVLDKDEANMIRNDQFPAYRCPQAEILRIEGFVEEWGNISIYIA